VVALDGADFELYHDEIVAVIGDNGAGKSTLIKSLSGALQPDRGEIRLDGEPVRFRSPGDARSAGIETVYQDLALAPSLDIASNIFLGREARRRGPLGRALRMLAKRMMRREAALHLQELKIGVQSMSQPVENLSGGQRQGVAVARAAKWAQRVAIMDEPTAALGVTQTANVLELVRRLADQGHAVMMVSHNLNDVFQVADQVAVLYLGRMVAVRPTAEVDRQIVVDLMTSGASTRVADPRPSKES